MNSLDFSDPSRVLSYLDGQKRVSINFFNLHDVYQVYNSLEFRKAIQPSWNVNSIDGFVPSIVLSLKNMKRIGRFSGPDFTFSFLKRADGTKRHLFIGLNSQDLDLLVKKFPNLDRRMIFAYNPPFVKGIKFPSKEIKSIAKIINSKKISFVWVGLGCPKQNILASSLFKKTRAKYFFNVGAALDFVLGKKKRAPILIRKMGIEWLYRLLTDFKRSRIKVWRSFVALGYLGRIKLK